MTNLTSVGITSGVPSSGTGTVSTIDAMFSSAAGGLYISSNSGPQTVVNSSVTALYLSSNSAGVVALGQATAANSLPVVLASNSTAFTVTPSSNFTVIASSVWTVTLSSNPTITSLTSAVVNLAPTTSGGLSVSSIILSTTNNLTSVKGTAGQLYGVEAFNVSTSPCYVSLYNSSIAPTAGSTSWVTITAIPNSSLNAGGYVSPIETGVAYSAGIAYSVNATLTASSTIALPTANAVILNVYYK